jgi:hypothetical protein
MLSSLKEFTTRDTSWLELTNAVMLAVWAIVLILPPPAFASNPSYATMALWSSESVWALSAMFFALCGIAGLRFASSVLRSVGMLGGVFFWGTVGAAIVLASHGVTVGWVYLAFANVCAVAHVCRWRS